jgi:hypothetical protein
MREAVPSGLYIQFLLIGAMCPRFGALIQAWLFVEERLADGLPTDEADFMGDDGNAELCSGWLSQEGPVWRWQHVTRFGSVLVIPILWFVERDVFDGLQLWLHPTAGVFAGIASGAASCGFVFSPGLARQVDLWASRSGLLTKSVEMGKKRADGAYRNPAFRSRPKPSCQVGRISPARDAPPPA